MCRLERMQAAAVPDGEGGGNRSWGLRGKFGTKFINHHHHHHPQQQESGQLVGGRRAMLHLPWNG